MISWLLVPAVGAVWIAAAGGIGAALGRRPEGSERHPAVTSDGWTLTVHRLPPQGPARAEPPVILAHGLMMNSACWSLSPQGSLARALAGEGFDVWFAEYRSTDSALPPDGDETPGRWDYEFDDIPRADLPAIIETVRTVSGAHTVSWVGHSMGGIVLYQYAEQHGCDALHRVVTLGSPVRYGHVGRIPPRGTLSAVGAALERVRSTNVRLVTKLGLPAVALHPRPFMYFSGNAALHSRREQLTLAHHALQDNAAAVPRWFFDRMQTGEPQSSAAVRVPLLVLAGSEDVLAPPGAVAPAFADSCAPVAGLKVYGDAGAGPPFGHSDLIPSVAAVEHVLPDLVNWLAGDEPTLRGGRVKRPEDSPAPMET